MQLRITRSARRHRVGNSHILAAVANADTLQSDGDALVYVGVDDVPDPLHVRGKAESTMKGQLQQAIRAGEVEVVDDEHSLDDDPITLPSGQILDEAGAETYGREVADRAAGLRGRPSLTGPGEHSPKISARVHPTLKQQIADLAARDGRRPADIVRDALEEYVAAHG